jgi:hypothetical protein
MTITPGGGKKTEKSKKSVAIPKGLCYHLLAVFSDMG